MDCFGSSDDEDDEVSAGRPAACGPLTFHAGTEAELVRVVEAEAVDGDASSVLRVIDAFCWRRHWMMHVGDVKGRILEAAARRAVAAAGDAPVFALELGSYCGFGACVVGRALRRGDSLLSLDVEAACVDWATRVATRAGLVDDGRVAFGLAGRDEPPRAAVARLRPRAREAAGVAKIRLLFVDHDKGRYLEDLVNLEPILEEGCVVVTDNVLSLDGGASLSAYLARVRDRGLPGHRSFDATWVFSKRLAERQAWHASPSPPPRDGRSSKNEPNRLGRGAWYNLWTCHTPLFLPRSATAASTPRARSTRRPSSTPTTPTARRTASRSPSSGGGRKVRGTSFA